MMSIKSLWIHNEHSSDAFGQPHNPLDTFSDVMIRLDDHSRWVGTFISYQNIAKQAAFYRTNGENLDGCYIWESGMMLVDMVTRERITQVINDILEKGYFEKAFSRCPYDADQDD